MPFHGQTVPHLSILSQKLIDARKQLKLLFRGEVLVFIEKKLELVLQALDELVQTDLVLVVRQLGQGLHRAISLISFEHYGVQDLRHDEKVINLLPEDVLHAQLLLDLELIIGNVLGGTVRSSVRGRRWGVSLSRGSRFEK